MIVIHGPGKDHVDADALSRIPDSVDYYANYTNNIVRSWCPTVGVLSVRAVWV